MLNITSKCYKSYLRGQPLPSSRVFSENATISATHHAIIAKQQKNIPRTDRTINIVAPISSARWGWEKERVGREVRREGGREGGRAGREGREGGREGRVEERREGREGGREIG